MQQVQWKNKKIILPVIVMLLLGIAAFSASRQGWFRPSVPAPVMPDAAAEYRLLMARFSKEQPSFCIAGTVNLFDSPGSKDVRETMEFMSYRNRGSFYSSIGSRFTLCDGEWVLSWDTLSREMFLDVAPDLSLLSQPFSLPFNDTSALTVSGEVVESNKEQRVLALKSDLAPEVKICYVQYHPVSYAIQSAEIHWWDINGNMMATDTGKVWITKVSYRSLSPETLSVPLVKDMVRIGKDTAVPLGIYAEYQLQANLFKEP